LVYITRGSVDLEPTPSALILNAFPAFLGLCVLSLLCVCAQAFGHVRLFVNPWTVAHQAPLSMGFPRQEYWSELPLPTLGDLPNPGIKPILLHLLHWRVDTLPLCHLESPNRCKTEGVRPGICVNKPSMWFHSTVKFENHTSKA